MSHNIGRITKIGYGIETTWGTKASSIAYMGILEFNPSQQIAKAEDTSAIGRVETPLRQDNVRTWSEPTLSAIVYSEHVGAFLKAIFGTVATSTDTPEAGVYTHDFTVKNDNEPLSMTLTYKDANQDMMITGAVVNTATINFVSDDYVKMDLTFIGKYPEATTETPACTSQTIFTGNHCSIKHADTVAGLTGATAVPFQTVSLEITKNAEAVFALGSGNPTKIVSKQVGTMGNFEIIMDSTTYRDYFEDNTAQAIEFKAENTSVTIGTSTNPSFTFTLANANVESWEQSTGLDDLISETFGFKGNYLCTDNMIDAQLINTTASY